MVDRNVRLDRAILRLAHHLERENQAVMVRPVDGAPYDRRSENPDERAARLAECWHEDACRFVAAHAGRETPT